ncbi:cupin domain-containing protein [Actinomycetota bacterium Odt1-20B]
MTRRGIGAIGTWTAAVFLVAGVVGAVAGCGGEEGSGSGAARPAGSAAESATSKPPAPLVQQALPNVKGKTFTSRIVEFPPGGGAPAHRHGKAFVYAYVLDGTVRSRLEGEPAHTYRRGQTWTEQPGAHHVTTQNVSRTKRARLLVVFVSDTGDELKVDDPVGKAKEERP